MPIGDINKNESRNSWITITHPNTENKLTSIHKVIPIQIINKSNNELPSYQTNGSSGLDLRAFIENDIILKPLERNLIPTGIYIKIPEGYEAQIRPRSGLAIKHGITVLNTPGTIDFDFIGQIQIILINLSTEDFTIKSGDRIAQIVFSSVEKIYWELTEKLEETERSEGGFGHSGLK